MYTSARLVLSTSMILGCLFVLQAGAAQNPNPANGAVQVDHDTDLSWLGTYATEFFDVYLGTSHDAVANATHSSPEFMGTQPTTDMDYDPGSLAYDTYYYWRIDEIIDGDPSSPWVGNVWSFKTAEEKRTLTISSTSGGSVTTPGEGSYQYNHGSSVPVTATADTNYHFTGWTGTAVGAGKVANASSASTTVTMDADYTLQANFAIDKRTLTISSTSGGSVTTPGEGSYQYNHGSSAPVTATAQANYHFTGWTGTAVGAGKVANAGSASTTVTMDADYTLQANFAIDKRTLSISSTSGGSVTTPGEGSYQYNHGSSAPVTATAQANYHFTGWTGTAVGAGKVANPNVANTTVTMDADYTLKANFVIDKRTLTISSTSGGSVTTPGEGSFEYDYGSEVTITASADSNYHFTNWSGSIWSMRNPITITMDAYHTVQANFAIDQRTLTISSTSGGSVTTPGEGTFSYAIGTEVSIKAQADPDCTFLYWTGSAVDANKVADPYSAATTIVMGDDYTLDARFASRSTKLYVGAWDPNNPNEYGTIDNPFHGIQDAIDVAPPGATIVVGPGVYAGGIVINDEIYLVAQEPNDPNEAIPPVILGDFNGPVIHIIGTADVNCLIDGFIVADGSDGIVSDGMRTVISNCVISGNESHQPEVQEMGLILMNALNDLNTREGYGIVAKESDVVFVNCTITGNSDGGLCCSDSTVTLINCIIWNNAFERNDATTSIKVNQGDQPFVVYSDIQMPGNNIWPGEGNINADPLFADPGYCTISSKHRWFDGDYHLKSWTGRWDPQRLTWVRDLYEMSPCIDSGAPSFPVADEPAPNGYCINMGAYGGTTQASKSFSMDWPAYFADPKLKQCVIDALAALDPPIITSEPTPNDMLRLKELVYVGDYHSGPGYGDDDIVSLIGLEHAKNLEVLKLYFNEISDISPLFNTDTQSGLTDLTYLDLGYNNISDISALAGLTKLTYLDLRFNEEISDISPLFDTDTQSGLTDLTYLDLGYNNISDISALAGLTSLTTLSLDGCQIDNDDLTTLYDTATQSGLTILTELSLWDNQISDISALAGLTDLTGLNLGMNDIDDISPLHDERTGSGLTKLTYLNLYDNDIWDIDSLWDRHYDSASGGYVETGLMDLKFLDLGNNHISSIYSLRGLTKLNILYLGENRIEDLSALYNETTGLGLTELWILDLTSQGDGCRYIQPRLESVHSLAGLKHLKKLYLSDNCISYISPLTELDELEKLVLSGNPLNEEACTIHIPDIFEHNPGIDLTYGPACQDSPVFFVDENLKACVEAALGVLNPTPNDMLGLIWLDAHAEDISDLTGLEYATNIEHLDIRSNDVSDLSTLCDPDTGVGLRNLTYLDLSYNHRIDYTTHWANKAILRGLTDLTELYLENTGIGNNLSALGGLTNLEILDLSYNGIDDISPLYDTATHSGLTNLTELYLNDNQITDISVLTGLRNLKVLDLSNNRWTQVVGMTFTFGLSDISPLYNEAIGLGLTNLQELYLNNNKITDISALAGLINLKVLDLSYNRWMNSFEALGLSDISPLSYTGLGLTNLRELYLNNNQITDISALPEAEYRLLDLSENPLTSEAYCSLSQIYEDYSQETYPGIDLRYSANSNPPTGVQARETLFSHRVEITWEPVCSAKDTELTEYRVYRSAVDYPAHPNWRYPISRWFTIHPYEEIVFYDTESRGYNYYYWVKARTKDWLGIAYETDFSECALATDW